MRPIALPRCYGAGRRMFVFNPGRGPQRQRKGHAGQLCPFLKEDRTCAGSFWCAGLFVAKLACAPYWVLQAERINPRSANWGALVAGRRPLRHCLALMSGGGLSGPVPAPRADC